MTEIDGTPTKATTLDTDANMRQQVEQFRWFSITLVIFLKE